MTDLEAANRALLLIGVEPVGSLLDATKAARTVRGLLEGTKDAVLCEFPWSFASKAVAATPSGGAVPAGYEGVFVYPADALNLFRVFTERERAVRYAVVNGAIAVEGAGGADVCLEYAVGVHLLDAWRRDAQEAFCVRLAHDACYALVADQTLAVSLFEKYAVLIAAAKGNSAVEEGGARPYELAGHYLRVRG